MDIIEHDIIEHDITKNDITNNNITEHDITEAARIGDLETIEKYYNMGLNLSIAIEYGCYGKHSDIVEWLLERNVPMPEDVLFWPCVHSDAYLVSTLLKSKANPNPQIGYWEPLLTASRNGAVDIIHQLYIYGANLHYEDTIGNALHHAYTTKQKDSIKALINLGVDKFHPNKYGIAPSDMSTTPGE